MTEQLMESSSSCGVIRPFFTITLISLWRMVESAVTSASSSVIRCSSVLIARTSISLVTKPSLFKGFLESLKPRSIVAPVSPCSQPSGAQGVRLPTTAREFWSGNLITRYLAHGGGSLLVRIPNGRLTPTAVTEFDFHQEVSH